MPTGRTQKRSPGRGIRVIWTRMQGDPAVLARRFQYRNPLRPAADKLCRYRLQHH